MNKIVITIPTYKRPEMLRKLLLSIKDCRLDKSLIGDVTIIVVDNDIEKTAEKVVTNFLQENTDVEHFKYHSYAEKGLSKVRNEMLRKAFELNPDFIVFVDDDEYVTAEWLNEMMKVMINNNADLVRGPALAQMAENTPDYISCWFSREEYPDNCELHTLTSGNLMMRRTTLQKFGIWFDLRFNTTGSEDSYFGRQMQKKGAKIYWAAKAIAYEIIPPKRTTLRWLMMRNYRSAGTFTYILKVEKESLKLLKKIIISIIYVIVGFLSGILVLFPVKRRYWGLLKLSEGLGAIAGLGNKIYSEYK